MSLLNTPACQEMRRILREYDRMHEALLLARDDYQAAVVRLGPFHGLTRTEFEEALISAAAESDEWCTLMLLASVEQMFFDDAEDRIQKRTKDGIRRRLADLPWDDQRVTFGALAGIWRETFEIKAPFQRIFAAFDKRHWLAHGRRWSLKTPFRGNAWDAWGVIEDLILAIQRHAPDFPRLG